MGSLFDLILEKLDDVKNTFALDLDQGANSSAGTDN